MPRRKFAHIDHDTPRLAERRYWPASLHAQGHRNPIPTATMLRWSRQMGFGKTPTSLLYAPALCGYNDPVTIACVLDLILRSETDTFIEAGGFTERLRDMYGHLVQWDPYTVGKILSRLAQEERDVANRPTTAHAIDYVQAGGARKYAILEDFQAWLWLAQVRDYMGRHAEDRISDLRAGRKPRRLDDIWFQVSELPWGVAP